MDQTDLAAQIAAAVTAALANGGLMGAKSLPQNPSPNRTQQGLEETKSTFSGGMVDRNLTPKPVSTEVIAEYVIIDLQWKPEITTEMEKLSIAEKTSKQSKTQVTDFQNKQKEVERLRMSLHGFLVDWEEEFENASDQTDFEELLRSLRSSMADQALERCKAAWGETSDSATKLGEVTSSQGEAQAIVN